MNKDRPHSLSRHRLREFDYADQTHAFFVTIRAKHGTSPFKNERLAREIITSLEWLRANADLVIYSYCLMPDHLHLLVQLGNDRQKLGITIRRFKTLRPARVGNLA